jgi:hypothetical protein
MALNAATASLPFSRLSSSAAEQQHEPFRPRLDLHRSHDGVKDHLAD